MGTIVVDGLTKQDSDLVAVDDHPSEVTEGEVLVPWAERRGKDGDYPDDHGPPTRCRGDL